MNDLDRATFTKFTERFGRIERQIPAPPSLRVAGARERRGFLRASPRAALAAVGIVLAVSLGLAAIGAHPSPVPSPSPAHVAVPPDAAGPAEVFDAYLRALEAGDCNTAHLLGDRQLLSGSFVDLCTTTHVIDFAILGDPVVESPYRVRVKAIVTTTGFSSGVGPGQIAAVYWLQHQSSGAWRISDGSIGAPTSTNTPCVGELCATQ